MVESVVESDSEAIEQKLQTLLKFVVRQLYDMKREIEHILADPNVVKKTDVGVIVRNCLTKCTSTLQWQMVKAVEPTFEDALHASYINYNSSLKSTMFQGVE